MNRKLKHSFKPVFHSAALLAVLAAVAAGSAQAQTQYATGNFTWDNGTTAAWGAASGGPYTAVWTSGNNAVFEGTAGTVSIDASGATAHNLTFNTDGYLIQDGTLTLSGSTPILTLGASINSTISSVIDGSAGLTKSGSGTLTLSASNTYSGPTAITGGTLAVTPGAALGSGLVTLSGGAALSLVGTFQQFDLAPFKNTVVAQDYLPGWLPSYAFDGNTGTRWVGLNNSDPNWIYIDLGSDHVLTQVKIAWEYASAQDYTIRTATSAQGTYGNDLTQWTVAGTVTGNGPGTTVTTTLTVPTTARYLGMYGTSRASPYSYSIWEIQAFGYAAVTDTIASLSSADPTASVNLDPNVTLNVGTDNTSTSFAGIVTGGGALTKQGTGTLTLSGLNTYTGSTTVSNGTLALSDTAWAFSTIANSPVATVASGATLDVSGISSGFHLLTGQSLWGNGSVNGAVTVDSGATLTVGGGAGTPGTLSFNDSLTLGGSTLLRIGKGLVPSNDVVQVTGLFTSGGTLVVSNVGGTLALGDSFKLFSAGSYSGAFVSSSLPNPGLGLAWDTSQLAVSGVITIARATGPPLILVQPQGTNVVEGTTVTLSVSATGTMPLHYQWYSSTGALPNQTNATLVLNNVLVADSYYVTVDNSVGPTATSDTVLVTVEQAPPPQIVVPPLALFLPVGSHATFSVAAFSTLPISYQWQFNYADIPDATNASLTVTNAQLTDAGTYAVNVSNIRGFTNAAPASLNLTTLPLLYIPIANPSFEIPVLADGAVGSPAGWTTSGGWASWNPQNGQWPGATYGDPPPSTIPDGNNVYQMAGAGSYVTQVLGTNYLAGAHYQLSAFVGARGDEGGGYSGNYQIQLLRGDTHAVVAETTGSLGAGDRGAWQQVLVNFDATSAQAGTPMEVRAINSSGGQVGVDNFSLWFTNSLPPQPPQPVLDPSRFTTPSGVPTFNFDTVAGYKYRLVYTANVANAMTAWLPVIDEPNYPASRDGWSITSGGQAMTIQDLHTAGQPHRFYRIEAATP